MRKNFFAPKFPKLLGKVPYVYKKVPDLPSYEDIVIIVIDFLKIRKFSSCRRTKQITYSLSV